MIRRPGWRGLLAVTVLTIAPALWAQRTTSAVTGTVKDQSGAAAPGVTVTAIHAETGQSRAGVTDETGYYRLPLLEIGEYVVEAAKDGFRKSRYENVQLEFEREAVVDHVLEIGQASESIIVESRPRTIASAPSALTSVVDSTEMRVGGFRRLRANQSEGDFVPLLELAGDRGLLRRRDGASAGADGNGQEDSQ